MLSLINQIILAAPAAEPLEDAKEWIEESADWMIEQFQNGNYLPAVAMGVMLLVWLFRKLFMGRVSSKLMPLFSAAIGLVTVIGANLISLAAGYDTMSVVSIVLSGLLIGTSASGFWDLIGRHVAAKVEK